MGGKGVCFAAQDPTYTSQAYGRERLSTPFFATSCLLRERVYSQEDGDLSS